MKCNFCGITFWSSRWHEIILRESFNNVPVAGMGNILEIKVVCQNCYDLMLGRIK
jgi:hypothetical protein